MITAAAAIYTQITAGLHAQVNMQVLQQLTMMERKREHCRQEVKN